MSGFVTADRDIQYRLPPLADEWLPGNHPARFIVEIVDRPKRR